MRTKLIILISTIVVIISAFSVTVFALGGDAFAGQDLHLYSPEVIIFRTTDDQTGHVLVFENDFSMVIGSNRLSSESAVVWVQPVKSEYRGKVVFDYNVQVYLEKNVTVEEGISYRATDIGRTVIEQGQALVTRFLVSGEIFTTADTHSQGNIDHIVDYPVYENAAAAVKPVLPEPIITEEAMVPTLEQFTAQTTVEKKQWKFSEVFKELPKLPEKQPPVEIVKTEPEFEYPVNVAALFEPAPVVERTVHGQTDIVTVIGRFYLWQKRGEDGQLLEFQADNAVIYLGGDFQIGQDRPDGVIADGAVESVYLKGNIVMTEGDRTVKAQELFYDFKKHQAIAIKAQMSRYEPSRDVPVYLRAAELRQVSDDMFSAENITLTTSEFYLPQISMTASKLILSDVTAIDRRTGQKAEQKEYDGQLYDVRMKLGETTLFKWPKFRTDFKTPDVPIKKLTVGGDSDFGTSVESRWYLSKLLGRQEPEGVDSTLAIDYFSKRGLGLGINTVYKKQDYYGNLNGYIIDDRGTDNLGRTRDDLDPDTDIRGTFGFKHRHYLPYDWQATIELDYISDENFIESYFRNDFFTSKARETLVSLKKITDNMEFSILGKVRINDFSTETEELPTVQFHIKGQSFWDDTLTYYNDNQIGRMRFRTESDTAAEEIGEFYTFGMTRHEVDMPLMWEKIKLVPFVGASYAYEDLNGYDTNVDGAATDQEKDVWYTETGLRLATMFWKEDQFARSRLWDINGIRHIVKPHAEYIAYQPSDSVIDMHDTINVGVSQRWQTRRGPKQDLRNVDWMRLDVDATWVKDGLDDADDSAPAFFLWNDPSVPLLKRRSTSNFGLLRDSVNIDYLWCLSDTTTVLSDLNYDIEDGVIQQQNIGFSRFVYPDLSYYLGSRYLRPLVIDDPANGIHEEGSHSFVFSTTYKINERYTASFSQEYDFDFGHSVRSELALVRHYHRMYYALMIATDESMERSSISFSVWPEGVKELALGSRRYVGLVGNSVEQ